MSEQKERYINPLTDFGSKLFEEGEIAKFTPKERDAYEINTKTKKAIFQFEISLFLLN